MDPLIQAAFDSCRKGQSFAFATIVENTLHGTARKSGAKMVVMSDGSIVGTIGGGVYEKSAIRECLKTIKTQKPKLVSYESFGKKGQGICGGKFSVFIEPFASSRHLVICGAGHIALPLSLIAKLLNFKVTVLDNRREFANRRRFPHADAVLAGNPVSSLKKVPINGNVYVVIVTHGHEHDLACLKAVIHSPAAYIGVIGSRNKREDFRKKFSREPQAFKKIKIPCGLDLGSQTPEEIAVSIMAEIVSRYNKDWRNSAKFLTK